MSHANGQPPKIVYIKTQFVETDASSFKSVVQRLTGKDSVVPANPAASAGQPPNNQPVIQTPAVSAAGGPVFPRAASFKDIDRLLTELQPLDELFRLWSD
ncbi:VQ motif-containing protein 10-like [Diospyros lotus]|uniref:VQ motif-containing protein 10-like n=1 Tax=Diospyros lotus TaxID=55363 RepID=UPI00224D955D|nr:VQ motif-containing protein 10-like [Diospyros lotus]